MFRNIVSRVFSALYFGDKSGTRYVWAKVGLRLRLRLGVVERYPAILGLWVRAKSYRATFGMFHLVFV